MCHKLLHCWVLSGQRATWCCGQRWVWHMFCGKGLWWVIPTNKIHPIGLKHHLGFNRSYGPYGHTVSRCLIFPALPEVKTQSTHVASFSSYLRVNMGCALAIVFQVRSLNVPNITGYPTWSLFPGVPSFRLHSEINQIHLSIEAQCGTASLPMGDCHTWYFLIIDRPGV